MLTGIALKETVAAMQAEGKKPSEIAIACGYCTVEGSNTKIHFTDFYTELLKSKGTIIDDSDDNEPEEIKAEDSDYQEQINELLEDYPADAIRAFIELYGEDDLDRFSDSYQGEMSGAEFAQQFAEDCYGVDLPGFVEVDWQGTWENLEQNYSEQDGFIFSESW